VLIGANAVVLIDVPSDSVAVGVPARALPRKTMRPTAMEGAVTAEAEEAHGVYARSL